MRSAGKFVKFGGTGALALFLAATSFAAPARDSRGSGQSGYDRGTSQSRAGGRDDRGYQQNSTAHRDNERVNMTGRITSLTHDRGGYRVQLDRGRESYWIPEARIRNRGTDLRVGVSIILGGIFRGGMINVDAVNYPGNYGDGRYDQNYDQGLVQGVVERVDSRGGDLLIRDDRSGRTIEVDARRLDRSTRLDTRDLRRGDYVTISGQWVRDGFIGQRIESINSGRY